MNMLRWSKNAIMHLKGHQKVKSRARFNYIGPTHMPVGEQLRMAG